MKKKYEESDFFVSKRELGKLFDSKYPLDVHLWRGQKPADT